MPDFAPSKIRRVGSKRATATTATINDVGADESSGPLVSVLESPAESRRPTRIDSTLPVHSAPVFSSPTATPERSRVQQSQLPSASPADAPASPPVAGRHNLSRSTSGRQPQSPTTTTSAGGFAGSKLRRMPSRSDGQASSHIHRPLMQRVSTMRRKPALNEDDEKNVLEQRLAEERRRASLAVQRWRDIGWRVGKEKRRLRLLQEENSSARKQGYFSLLTSSIQELINDKREQREEESRKRKRYQKYLQPAPGNRKEENLQYLVKTFSHLLYFKDRTPAVVLSLFRVLKLESYAKGDIVFNEGDTGTCFYIVVWGSCTALVNSRLGLDHAKVAAHFTPGFAFGEVAITRNQPRSATVLCDSDCELFRVEREDYLRVLKSHDLDVARQRADMIAELPLFCDLPRHVIDRASWMLTSHTFKPDEVIAAQGEESEYVYFVTEGHCEVTHTFVRMTPPPPPPVDELDAVPASPMQTFHTIEVVTLGPGQYVGEECLGSNTTLQLVTVKAGSKGCTVSLIRGDEFLKSLATSELDQHKQRLRAKLGWRKTRIELMTKLDIGVDKTAMESVVPDPLTSENYNFVPTYQRDSGVRGPKKGRTRSHISSAFDTALHLTHRREVLDKKIESQNAKKEAARLRRLAELKSNTLVTPQASDFEKNTALYKSLKFEDTRERSHTSLQRAKTPNYLPLTTWTGGAAWKTGDRQWQKNTRDALSREAKVSPGRPTMTRAHTSVGFAPQMWGWADEAPVDLDTARVEQAVFPGAGQIARAATPANAPYSHAGPSNDPHTRSYSSAAHTHALSSHSPGSPTEQSHLESSVDDLRVDQRCTSPLLASRATALARVGPLRSSTALPLPVPPPLPPVSRARTSPLGKAKMPVCVIRPAANSHSPSWARQMGDKRTSKQSATVDPADPINQMATELYRSSFRAPPRLRQGGIRRL